MKKTEVQIGHTYVAKVSNRLAEVRIISAHPRVGWNAKNIATGRDVRILSAQRLRKEVRVTPAEVVAAVQAANEPPTIAQDGEPETVAIATPKAKGRKTRATAPATIEPRAKRMSGLDAAAAVLLEAGHPMSAREMVGEAEAKGYWKSPGGKTPDATVYSAIMREIKAKGAEARFRKADRGKFEHAAT